MTVPMEQCDHTAVLTATGLRAARAEAHVFPGILFILLHLSLLALVGLLLLG
jgi:hypothetical protein